MDCIIKTVGRAAYKGFKLLPDNDVSKDRTHLDQVLRTPGTHLFLTKETANKLATDRAVVWAHRFLVGTVCVLALIPPAYDALVCGCHVELYGALSVGVISITLAVWGLDRIPYTSVFRQKLHKDAFDKIAERIQLAKMNDKKGDIVKALSQWFTKSELKLVCWDS